MRHRKTACFGALVLEPHFAQSCGRFLLLTWGRFWRQQVPSPLWWRNLLQVLVRELNHFVATGISTVLLWLADAIRHCFLMLALLRPSRRTRRTEVGSKAPPAVAKSSPKAAKLRCAFFHSAERIVDELGLLYPENRGNLRKNMASVWRIVGSIRKKTH